MLRLEDFMEIQKLHHDGLSVSAISRQLSVDRKTVRKYLKQAPRGYERKAKSWQVTPTGRTCGSGGSWECTSRRSYSFSFASVAMTDVRRR